LTRGPGSAGHAAVNTATAPSRDEALDFAKGALVVLMLVYHWLNRFVGVEGDAYRYIRFISPSFIFMSGFVVSRVYLTKYSHGSKTVAHRLLRRGFKLICLFVALNLILAIPEVVHTGAWSEWATKMMSVSIWGEGKAAFTILLSIGYFLVATPLVLFVSTRLRVPLMAVAAGAITASWVASVVGRSNLHLEFLSMGLIGLAAGAAGNVYALSVRPSAMALAVAYALYLAATAAWNVIFPVQVIGVCVNVLVLYRLGLGLSGAASTRWVVTLGQYSLVAYVVQIVILRLLRLGVAGTHLSLATLALTFAIALLWTVGSVQLVALLRDRTALGNRLYRTVFA
jgi:peptidoglycan/LPS O-acetylase OafA/YrhL